MEMRRVLKNDCSEYWYIMEKLTLSVIVRLLLFDVLRQVGAVTVHYLHWNSSNPIFRIDNTDHIVDVNQGNHQNKTHFLESYVSLSKESSLLVVLFVNLMQWQFKCSTMNLNISNTKHQFRIDLINHNWKDEFN